jgi:UDP-GlcNAc:undecaprenyl-phosphate GlcNAc-1-phosphate transferase
MGDGGSLFLGYTLSTLAIHQDYGRSRSLVAVIAAPVLLLLIPIFDTTFVTVVRIVRGRPVSQGGRDHTSHRLVTLGLTERRAVLTLWLIATIGGALAVFARLGYSTGVWVTTPLLAIGLAFIAIHLARTDAPAPGSIRPGGVLASAAFSLGSLAYKLRILEVLLDASLAMISLMAAFLLRFDGNVPDHVAMDMIRVFPIVIALKVVMLLASGAYEGIWRHVSLHDLVRLTRGTLAGSVAAIVVIAIWLRFGSISRGALIIDALLFTALVTGSRVSFRVLRMLLSSRRAPAAKRVLLWGAGDGGALVMHQLRESPRSAIIPVGFVDDDRLKIGRSIHGLRVLGSSGDLQELLAKYSVDEVLVTSLEIAPERVLMAMQQFGEDRIRRLRVSIDSFIEGGSVGDARPV